MGFGDHSYREHRPSPEALLAQAKNEDEKRGRLKIFLGAAPGVGKTYTMLEAARARAEKKTDVVAGVVETHGRSETALLLTGLEILPRKRIEYRGNALEEMDLDALLARRPDLVLVDELAHTNAPGSRHPKRYLDVEEILAAGIDVYTTLNIQHLESLNDAVAQITGVRVRETVPDRIMERADEVELVDLPVEDLLRRLQEGKVYVPEQAQLAVTKYFRPGNLSALRQLALNHTAARVDAQMQTYMQAHAIPGPWPTTARLLVSVGPSPLSPRLVRATRRRAERLRAEWIAMYVETHQHHRLSEADRDRVAATLRLAGELGARTATIPGGNVADELLRYARSHNVTEIVIGKSHRSRWFELLHGSIVDRLIRGSGRIDVYVITGDEGEEQAASEEPAPAKRRFDDILWSTLAVCAAGLLGHFLREHLALPNLSMIFLTAVLGSAVLFGLRASIYTSILSVLVYDFFFVPPFHTFRITSPQDVLALVVFLIVAVLTSNLAGRIRDQAAAARTREARTTILYDLTRGIAGAVGLDNVAKTVVDQIGRNLGAQTALLLPEDDRLELRAVFPNDIVLGENERAAAVWAWRNNRAAGWSTDTLPGERWLYLPLRNSQRSIGVLAIRFESGDDDLAPETRRLLDAMADQAAIAIERAKLAHDIEQAKLLSERERLQAILLSSISHDLRTPLASILGSATSLLESGAGYDEPTRRELLATIQEESERLNRFVGNLLDTTRLESGALRLHREWIEIGDVIGAAIARLPQPLGRHMLDLEIPLDLPMARIDFVLIEQVFVNLLDNAAKYSDPGTTIRITAGRDTDALVIRVEDEGIGVPAEDLEHIFDKFFRVQQSDRQKAGTGLGLSICRGIVEEHGGTIRAASPARDGRGTVFVIRLPLESSPLQPEQPEPTA